MTDDFTGDPIEELVGLKARFAKDKKGFRQAKYGVLEEAMAVVVELRMNPSRAKEFGKLAKVAESKVRGDSTDWITLAAVDFVIPGKLSWKAARALDYLYDEKGVPLDELADKLEKFGGIEKLVKEAARERPRRKPKNDKPVAATSAISVCISSALLEKLKLVEAGRRIKLVGVRQEDDDRTDSMLKIRKMILING